MTTQEQTNDEDIMIGYYYIGDAPTQRSRELIKINLDNITKSQEDFWRLKAQQETEGGFN